MDVNTPFDFAASSCSREVFDVRFMYFSPEEVRGISVEELDEGPAFDEWGEQLDRGIFAPAMGPMANQGPNRFAPKPCRTCGLEKDCPGHMGRIELAEVLYNPFTMIPLYKLLNSCCLSCMKLKCAAEQKAELIRKLRLLQPGEFSAASLPDQSGKKRALKSDVAGESGEKRMLIERHPDPRAPDQTVQMWVETTSAKNTNENIGVATSMEQACGDAAQEICADAEQRASEAPEIDLKSGSALEGTRNEIMRFMKDFPSTKCANCGMKFTRWRKEGWSEFYIKRPGDKEECLVRPGDVRVVLREIWKNDAEILRWLVPGARLQGAEIFFLETLAIPPNRFRPPAKGGALGRPSTHVLNIVRENAVLRDMLTAADGSKAAAPGSLEREKQIQTLQLAVNSFLDSGKSEQHPTKAVPGIRQEFEKKEGIFRMKMMGKRVNFAARSVISPDLNIETSEIGIPQAIAEGLMYPEVAAPHNCEYLRKLVERGAVYPGCAEVHVPDTNGGKQVKNLKRMNETERKSLAKQLITDIETGRPPMTVFRHLIHGDPLLVNRQPTLHKPGIMAHRARVLRKDKTIRMHYVNCNTYNADFDGDEMNLHAPQDPIGRMEALLIARPDKQYLVPTSGKPLRGLIQDHVIAGTMLCKRDTFMDKDQVCLYLYAGLRAAFDSLQTPYDVSGGRPWVIELDEGSAGVGSPNDSSKVTCEMQKLKFKIDDPTIIKPKPVWTGKQVFSMLLKNLLRIYNARAVSMGGVHLKSKSKTPGDIWNGKMDNNQEEATVLFQDSDLLMGVMDKAQFGASMYGIVHLLYEVAGDIVVSMFFSAIARVFSLLLQQRGFTCAMMDLLLKDHTEDTRLKLMLHSRSAAKKVIEAWLADHNRGDFPEGEPTPAMLSEVAQDLLYQDIPVQKYESGIIGKMKESWSDMINKCIPIGQKLAFPKNCFSAMVQTGAKGSKVNQSQITCCLGQQELEGRLVPLMVTRRSLPCFAAYDLAPRTRGYIADRFLGGIRPQEFFFHCMAGREGLVDTAVKTARSGYLQRCLVKHLECLKIGYDLTVRDSDGSVLQFLYGEDGTDVTRSSYLFKFDELRQNFHMLKPLGDQQLSKLKGDLKSMDFGTAEMYMEAEKLVKAGEIKKARKVLETIVASQDRVRVKGFGETHAAANGAYARAAAESEGLRYQKMGDDSWNIHFSGNKWLIGRAGSKPVATKQGSDSQDALLTGPWKLKGAEGEVSVETAPSVDNAVLDQLKAALERLRLLPKSEYKRAAPLDPITAVLCPTACFGSTSEKHETMLQTYVNKEMAAGTMSKEEADKFSEYMRLKFLRCLAEPGEAVGVIAAQSMGEPSTQMTLNTFHLAGHGGANVTLGIPRLREIVQTASKSCSTPVMLVKVLQDQHGDTSLAARMKFAEGVQRQFKRITIMDLLARVTVHDTVHMVNNELIWSYVCRFEFLPLANISKKVSHLSVARIEEVMRLQISRKMKLMLKRIMNTSTDAQLKKALNGGEEGEAVGADAAAAEKEDDAEVSKIGDLKGRKADDDDDGSPKSQAPKKKKRKLLGAEDKAENQAEEVDDEGEMDDEAISEGSGMYSDNEQAPPDDEEAEEAPGLPMSSPPEASSPDASGDESDEGAGPKKAASSSASASQLVIDAVKSGMPVYTTKLENDTMSMVVTHRYKECPHSLFVAEVIEEVCRAAELQDPACEGVRNVHVKTEQNKKTRQDEVFLETEGINLFGLQVLHEGCVESKGIYTNNIEKIQEMYGIEAARTAVVKEIQNVFGHYGIDVDHRHLYLIADYMSQSGALKAFNRHGMQHATSPMLQMSFETCMGFLLTSVQESVADRLQSPASAIVMGQVPPVGTGCVSLLCDLSSAGGPSTKKREFKW